MLSALDKWIGKLLEKINLQNTIVIVTADHGEFVPSIKINGKTISKPNVWKLSVYLYSRSFVLLNSYFSYHRATTSFGPILKLGWNENLSLISIL